MEKPFTYEDYCHVRNLEEISDLCWHLSSMLAEKFVGYENELKIIHDLAMEFSRQFDEAVSRDDCLPF